MVGDGDIGSCYGSLDRTGYSPYNQFRYISRTMSVSRALEFEGWNVSEDWSVIGRLPCAYMGNAEARRHCCVRVASPPMYAYIDTAIGP